MDCAASASRSVRMSRRPRARSVRSRNGDTGVDYDQIGRLIAEWRPSRLIIGMPLHADGSPSEMTQAVDAFVAELTQYELPVETIDERYTSLEAERTLKNARRQGSRGRITKADIDAAAAVCIAERYLAR